MCPLPLFLCSSPPVIAAHEINWRRPPINPPQRGQTAQPSSSAGSSAGLLARSSPSRPSPLERRRPPHRRDQASTLPAAISVHSHGNASGYTHENATTCKRANASTYRPTPARTSPPVPTRTPPTPQVMPATLEYERNRLARIKRRMAEEARPPEDIRNIATEVLYSQNANQNRGAKVWMVIVAPNMSQMMRRRLMMPMSFLKKKRGRGQLYICQRKSVASQLAQQKEFNLNKPPAYHYDILVLGFTVLLCGLIGIPPSNGVLPQSPMHTKSLAILRGQLLRKDTSNCQREHGKPCEQFRNIWQDAGSFHPNGQQTKC
ncbi:hypothetical protein QYE76_045606 [Lolium multiflorum]|uniref:Bicarbonate transporter-like transmembrane domain-containing protein n=1 Tax=Lolium multiflorum TaxID=4521 RepID=A0AAD8TNB4_LOLMU|nr:hypothetical protein QYE76_045606 [Lolium multiflorum]